MYQKQGKEKWGDDNISRAMVVMNGDEQSRKIDKRTFKE